MMVNFLKPTWRKITLAFLLTVFSFFSLSQLGLITDPWKSRAVELSEWYVGPSGTASGSGTRQLPWDLQTAMSGASGKIMPGHTVWILPGEYRGDFNVSVSGTSDLPIKFRSLPEERATVLGTIKVDGSYDWIWGLEITNTQSTISAIDIFGKGVRAINNYIHDNWSNGIGAWNTGEGQIMYGNIIRRGTSDSSFTSHPHNVYTQNDYDKYGYKYFDNNILMDQGDPNLCPPGNCFNFHAYTEGGLISGMHLKNNIVTNGRFLIGGYNVPHHHEVAENNYFYNTTMQFGYRRPVQATIKNNYLGRSNLLFEYLWGAGEATYTKPLPSVITGNEIYDTPSQIQLRTSAYLSTGRCEGCPPIDSQDIVDSNKYYGTFAGALFANNTNSGTMSFDNWKNATCAAGKCMDQNSQVLPIPTGVRSFLTPNEYEPTRSHIALYNWGHLPEVNVDVSGSGISSGQVYSVYEANNPYGQPLATGIYNNSSISIPMENGKEFAPLLFKYKAATTSTSTSTTTTPPATSSTTISTTTTTTTTIPITTTTKATTTTALTTTSTSATTTTSTTTTVPVTTTTLPTNYMGVSFLSPASESTVSSRKTSFKVYVNTNLNVSRVELYIDGGLKTTDRKYPYYFNIDTSKLSAGSHTIRAVAYSTNGLSTSNQIVIYK